MSFRYAYISTEDIATTSQILDDYNITIFEMEETFALMRKLSQKTIEARKIDVDPENDQTVIQLLGHLIILSYRFGAAFSEIRKYTNFSADDCGEIE